MHTSGKLNKHIKPHYRALDMAEHWLRVAIKAIDRNARKDTRKHIPN